MDGNSPIEAGANTPPTEARLGRDEWSSIQKSLTNLNNSQLAQKDLESNSDANEIRTVLKKVGLGELISVSEIRANMDMEPTSFFDLTSNDPKTKVVIETFANSNGESTDEIKIKVEPKTETDGPGSQHVVTQVTV